MRNALVCLTIALMALTLGAAQADAAGCRACDVALEQCATGCSGLDAPYADKVACLMRCDNAAAQCTCDAPTGLRSEDFVNDREIRMTAAAACHSTTPCGSAYGSCASWSDYYDCGDPFCGVANGCGEDCEDCGPWPPLPIAGPEPEIPCPCFGPALKQYRERYRVCFDAAHNACTEYQRVLTVLGCGC